MHSASLCPNDASLIIRRVVMESRLWPSIHDALDTYYKRRLKEAEGYERLWRLIHVWESTYITTAMVACAAVRADPGCRECWLSVREELWGMHFDRLRGEFVSQDQGALHGKMERWLSILRHVEQLDSTNTPFLSALRTSLRHKTVDVQRFLGMWERVCPPRQVPDPVRCRLIDLFPLLNTFRNRLAHVPFPPTPISELANELEALTVAAWDRGTLEDGSEIPEAHNSGKGGWLCGSFAGEGILVRGSQADRHDCKAVEFVYLPSAVDKKKTERLDAAPFLHFGEMHEPHVLTRLLHEEDGRIEYTRFQAERQPIAEHRCVNLSERIPRPTRAEYATAESDAPNEAPTPTPRRESDPVPTSTTGTVQKSTIDQLPPTERAKWYMQNEQFDRAIEEYEMIVKERPIYHIGWGRLAIALRERAARRPPTQLAEALRDLDRSLGCLEQAAKHRSPDYKAEVAYYRSKSLWRKWHLTGRSDAETLRLAVESAIEAARNLSSDFILSWCDYVSKVAEESR